MNYHPDLNQKRLVTRLWLKQYLSISWSTLNKWVVDKHLPAPIKIGPRAVRFRLEDIMAFEAKLASDNKDVR